MSFRSEVAKAKLAIAMDIKNAVDHSSKRGHNAHDPESQGLHELLVSDLDAAFEHSTTPPSKKKLHAVFDRKERMARHRVNAPHVSEEERLWQEEFDDAVKTLEH